MSSKNHTIQQAREFLKQETLKEISEISDFTRLQTRAFCVIAKYGLQLDAKKEKLFSGDEWKNKTIPKQHLAINIKNILLLER